MKFQPFLTTDDLGIDLEEDSTDVSDEEVALALDTDTESDFSAKVIEFTRKHEGSSSFDLRRKGGILFCRVSIAAERQLFRMEWLRRST